MEAAVVSAAHGAMGSLLGKLGELLTAKYKLVTEAEGQIRFLKSELESMSVFLEDISNTEEPNKKDKCWAKEVRELSYDIEDSVSKFMHRVEGDSSNKPHGFTGLIKRTTKLLTTMKPRHDIAKEFEGLKVRVVEARERRLRYQTSNDAVSSRPNNTTIHRNLRAMYKETADLVGTEGPRDELIQLMDDQEGEFACQRMVLSIVGFGGLGKTTLANQIYRKLDGKFECRAFVPVSQKPNITKILRTILCAVDATTASGNSAVQTWEEPELINALRNFLMDKRYFIVIDDIWDASAWDILSYALPDNANGSRVIITTRIETVARECSTKHIGCVYKMKPLSDQDSRKLFFTRIFGPKDDCPPHLEEVSAEILKKCCGLPLAIITTSSLLASKSDKLIKDKEQWEYVLNSLGSSSQSLEGMRQILNLSYIDLPHCLKTCMLYLGIYPEDHTILKNDLVRQWVAEGFICKVDKRDPEDIAKDYFNELINRSMIQPAGEDDCNGEVVSCRVHDMMLDLILYKAKEDNFITVIDDIQDMARHPDKIRRLSFSLYGVMDDRAIRSVQLSQTRTLARFSPSLQLRSFLQFEHLRVLVIEISKYHGSLVDISGICHLFQLRFFKIVAGNNDVVFPSKFGGLQQLEMFEVQAGDIKSSNKGKPFVILPSDIVQLSRLLHLIVPRVAVLPDGIDNMKSLRTLLPFNCFNLDKSPENINSLGELTNLTEIEISCSRRCPYTVTSNAKKAAVCREVLHTCLEKLCNLKCLYIGYLGPIEDLCLDALNPVPASSNQLQRFHHLTYASWFSRIPQWIGQYHSLYDLQVPVKEVLEDDVRVLAHLPYLIRLRLRIRETPRDKIIITGSGFPVLKHFDVTCRRIPYLTFEAGTMATLERLELNFSVARWDRYGAAPVGMEHLSGLKELKVMFGWGAKESNRRAAESTLRSAAEMHPSNPVVNIECDNASWYDDYYEDKYESDDEKELNVGDQDHGGEEDLSSVESQHATPDR